MAKEIRNSVNLQFKYITLISKVKCKIDFVSDRDRTPQQPLEINYLSLFLMSVNVLKTF